ncbi:biliverdin-producing heme oxygenase [Flavobacterium plantiphilum]|uniref:biliverdin-producing heme oxygenase n=1 Tax=Flavobacterium plantiphilum TaxID=3163297 RepID=UPI0038B6A72E
MINSHSSTVSQVSFVDRLRLSTSALHKQLESLSLSQLIVSPEITVQKYAEYLQIMEPVVRDIELKVYPVISNLISDINRRKKLSLIREDLKVLGFSITNISTEFDADFEIPFALGIMYVLEGSSLGGRVILKNIENQLGFTAECGAQYFAGYKENTGSLWKSFVSEMVRYEQEQGCGDVIIEGANFAFRLIFEYLETGNK